MLKGHKKSTSISRCYKQASAISARFEIRVAIIKDEVSAVTCPKSLRTFEHSGKDDHGQRHEFFVPTETVVGHHVVLQLIAGTLGGEHIGCDIVHGIHHTHNRDIDIDPVVVKMRLHSMKPVDEYLITGEIVTEVIFGVSVAVIWAMR